MKATELIIGILEGFDQKQALSTLMNAVGIALVSIYGTETKSLDGARIFRREIERCIRVNFEKGGFRET